MKYFARLVLCLLFSLTLFAQDPGYKGIHQVEWEAHQNDPGQTEFSKSLPVTVQPLQKRSVEEPGLTHAVFGYLPDWEIGSAPQYLNYDVLSHIAVFDFTVSTSGNIIGYPSGWPSSWTSMMNTAHAKGVKLIMCVVEFNKDDINVLINDSTASQNFYEQVATLISTYNFDGVNIDFEGPYTADRGAPMNAFMQGLSDHIKTQVGEEQEISFAGPAVNWSGWDLPGLVDACDYVFIMGYAYWYNGSSTTGPCAPIMGSGINLVQTLVNASNGYGACDPAKLILGLPYYGNRWPVSYSERNTEGASTLGGGSSVLYASARDLFAAHGTRWSSRYEDSWTSYLSGDVWYQAWCNNARALDPKEKLVFSHNLMGTGMWALGYDDEHPELWTLLRNNFYHYPDHYLTDNFENGLDHFYLAPAYSGSTRGISTASAAGLTAETAYRDTQALRITLKDDAVSSENWRVRFLSGGGSPVNNVRLPRDREIRIALKTDQAGAEIALIIDDQYGQMEISAAQPILADNNWHEYAFDLRPADVWESYSGGNGSIDASYVTLDALYFTAPDQPADRIIYLDAVQNNLQTDTLTFTVSGYVYEEETPVADVAIADTFTNTAGYFERTFPYGESLVLTPVKTGLSFTPASYSIPLLNEDASVTFAAAPTAAAGYPDGFRLLPNYPNPFNGITTLAYSLPRDAEIRITVFDMLGRPVATLMQGPAAAGEHAVSFNGGILPSGVYVAALYVDGASCGVQKMILLK
ncbi:MAG: T9SS type A sorting domain-containing protein [Candidatus Marinimicrobia bacterium]|nr:T9SS type A sorting domain-containing protein [Candidatus Neomarinimicrobiota bacterium]